MKSYIKLTLVTIFALAFSACGGNASTSTGEPASAMEATAVAEIVSATQTAVAQLQQVPTETVTNTATLSTDYENTAPIQMQLISGVYMLEGTDQVVTAAQAAALLPLLTSLKGISVGAVITQEQVDSLVAQAVSVLTAGQIQAITAMQITQETAISAMQQLGVTMGGPGQGDGNAPAGGMGQPPQGTPPAGGPGPGAGVQPLNADQMGTPSIDGMQPGVGFVPPELIEALIEYLQGKVAS